MDQPPTIPPTTPQTPPPAPVKKGLPALAWVGIGCGGLLIIAIIVGGILIGFFGKKIKEFTDNPEKTGAELIVSMNPDLEKLSQDDEKGEMTIRTKGGEEMTLTYKDISEGRITVRDKDGNETRLGSADLSQVPTWVPRAPGLTDGVSSYHSEAGDQISGLFTGKTDQSAEQLKEFFKDEIAKLNMDSSRSINSSTTANGTRVESIGYSGSGKSITVVITEKPGSPTLVNTNYSEKK